MAPCCTTEVHDELKADDQRWQAARFIGVQVVDIEGPVERYECRNCNDCGSTLMRPVTVVAVTLYVGAAAEIRG